MKLKQHSHLCIFWWLYFFLQDKRSKFARFYFLGDEDLLDIVGQAVKKPEIIQPHLKKLFAGINSVIFSNDGRYITAIQSLEGELVPLKTSVSLNGEVEVWLSSLVQETSFTLKAMLQESISENKRGEYWQPSRFPSQILCLSEAVIFAEKCEKAIASNDLSKLLTDYKNQLWLLIRASQNRLITAKMSTF